ncbi:MAG: hypothetical protein WCH65_05940 [bacterium]
MATFDVTTITDLSSLQQIVGEVGEHMKDKTITLEQAQTLLDQLQQKYVDLTTTPQDSLEDEFASLQKIFDNTSIVSYTLPLWAKRLGMSYPKHMNLDTSLSKSVMNDEQTSRILVYTGDYDVALQQAKLIAQKAKLHVSKDFAQAQSLAKIGNVEYISGLDIGGLSKGIVYLNHELLDTKVENILSVSVDQYGVLTIETTKYN